MDCESDDSLQYEYAELFSLDEGGSPMTTDWFLGWSMETFNNPIVFEDESFPSFKRSVIEGRDTLQWISDRIESAIKTPIEDYMESPGIVILFHAKDRVDTLVLSGEAYADSELNYNRMSFCDTTLTLAIVRHICSFDETWKRGYEWCRENKWCGY